MPKQPNILWICTDQQRYDTIAALGYEHLRTPNLDRLCREGVAFTNTYCQNPVCTPSRASFLSGCYPSTIHVNRNGNSHFPPDVPLMTKMLADAGYECGLAGKLHLSAAHRRVEPRPDDGYGFFHWSHHPYPEEFWPPEDHSYQRWLQQQGIDWGEHYTGGLGIPQARDNFRTGIAPEYHQTTWCAEKALEFIRRERRGPWLMSVNPFDPHPPFDPPREYLERMDVETMPLPLFREEERRSQLAFRGVDHQTDTPVPPSDYDARRMVAAYCAQIELIDEHVGRMLDELERTGQREDTIVIFTSDHGDMLGDHGLLAKGCRFYEGAVHVPLLLSWPGGYRQGLRSGALVELMDLMPTLLDAAGLPTPGHVQARSLDAILRGEADPDHHRERVRCEYHDSLGLPDASHANMIFDGRHKLVVYHGREAGELYDLHKDPEEFCNLWDEPEALALKADLLKRCFDAAELITDPGQPRVGHY